MSKAVLLLLLTLGTTPVLAQGLENVPIYDLWASIPVSPFEFSENVIRLKQGFTFKNFIQSYEDPYIEPSLRTRDLPTPFNTSLRQELGYYEVTQNLPPVVNP